MLTADLIRPRLRKKGDELLIEWLRADNLSRQTAAELIELAQRCIGHTLEFWENALTDYEGSRTDYTIIRGLAKVLTDSATFTPIDTPIDPVDLRALLFRQGAVFDQIDLFHPRTRADILAETAAELGISVEQIENTLYADRPAESVLTVLGQSWTPDTLIDRYNLELARGALYWAREMRIELRDHYKDFFRYVKLFKLMFWALPLAEGGYHITLDGPISPFVRSTTRYGRQMAAFLPALLISESWTMAAHVRFGWMQDWLHYRLDPTNTLVSHFKRSGEFDSRLEQDFAAEFEAKFGGERGKWQLTREDELLLIDDTVFIPDFALTHKRDGRRALIEIVGYWTPEYLQRKLSKVRAAGRTDLILLIYEGVNLTGDKLLNIPGEILYFANKPVLKDVIAAAERVAK